MRTVGSSTLRGGQTVFHGLRMWGQLLRAAVFLSAFAIVAVPGWHIWHNTTGYEWYAAGIVTVAEAEIGIGYSEDAMQEVRMADGSTAVLSVRELARSPRARAVRERLKDEVFASAFLGAKASLAVIALFLALFWYRGWQLHHGRRVRGAELATAGQLRRRIRPLPARLGQTLFGRPGPDRIAGVPYPERTETQHTIVSGTTGSGKTVLISDLAAQIRDRGEGGGCLFLTSRGDQHASLRGLISTWLEIAVNAMLSLAQDDGRRIWVILDELPTLHLVPSLQPGLAESRQFGGCFVLGVQVISALRDLYGRNGAETISGLCGTRVVLAAPDRDTAQWSADSLGRSEVEEVAEGFSYGANTIRDGVSLTPKRELRALALPSEIMRLENLSGYLRFPGPLPVATIRLDYVDRAKAAERFVPRTEPDGPEAAPLDGSGPDEGPPEAGAEIDAERIEPQGELDLGSRPPELESWPPEETGMVPDDSNMPAVAREAPASETPATTAPAGDAAAAAVETREDKAALSGTEADDGSDGDADDGPVHGPAS